MNSQVRLALAMSTILGAAAFAGAADAQQGPSSPPAAAGAAMPSTPTPAAPNAQAPAPRGGPTAAARARQGMLARLAQMQPSDRNAMIDAHIAALKAGLELTPDQEKLWPTVESAIRNSITQALTMRQKFAQEGRPSDPMQRLSRLSEAVSARAETLKQFVNAAQPLYASLTPDQKRRIPMLMGMMGGAGAMGGPAERGAGPSAPRGPAAMGPERGPPPEMGYGPGRGPRMGQSGPRGEGPAGADQTWRERMRERMHQMYQNRDQWRGEWRDRNGYGDQRRDQNRYGDQRRDRDGQPYSDESDQ